MPRIIPALCLLAGLALTSAAPAQTLYRACSTTLPDVTIPPDAMWPVEIIKPEYRPPQKMTDKGFTHIVAAINVVSVHPCDRGRGAMIEIRSLRLIRYNPALGTRTVEQTITASNGTNTLIGETYNREPRWFQSGKPTTQPWVTWIQSSSFAVNMQTIPLGIYHWWTHPRLRVQAGYPYFIEAVVRVTGDARIQFGIDYWRGSETPYNGWSEACANSNNCEAFQTHWVGSTDGQFVTVITPQAMFLP
ncbi:MAG: hypothetical protein WAT81_00970 [Candidatus Moraniibacteriota bacterium]